MGQSGVENEPAVKMAEGDNSKGPNAKKGTARG